nr:retrovirus-related Pol polyprotein from transposon TNT 1-94 [Tanacetum cinerariifolium]
MTTPHPTPFLATTPRARVLILLVIISDSVYEITTLPVRPTPSSTLPLSLFPSSSLRSLITFTILISESYFGPFTSLVPQVAWDFHCKEIAKPITPLSDLASKEDSYPEQAQRVKEMQKNLVLIAKYFKKINKPTNNNLRTSSNSKNKNVDTFLSQVVQQNEIQCFNCKKFGHFAKEFMKPKRVKDYSYHKEKMLMYKQAEKGGPLQAEQADWLARQHSEQPKSISNTCVVEKVDSNVIPDSPDMCNNDIQTDQNAVECDDERVALANLIANLKLDRLVNSGESNSIRDSCLIALQSKQTELETYKTLNDRIVDYEKLEPQSKKPCLYEIPYDTSNPNRFVLDEEETLTLEKESRSKLKKDLVRPYDYTKQNSLYENFKPASQEYHEQLAHENRYVESLEKEIDELESDNAEFSNRDGENLDKMKEKGDMCILVGYSTQSKGYRVYNKRTRLIVESIHVRFDEIKEMSEMSVDNNTSGLVLQR